MNMSSRYTVALHVLTAIAFLGNQWVTSETIAISVNTNPVVIRRLLATLLEAKLVKSQGGPGGGWRLTRKAERITLRDVYRAVEGSTLFPLHGRSPNPFCVVGRTIQPVLANHFETAQVALEKELGRTTIADLLHEVTTLDPVPR